MPASIDVRPIGIVHCEVADDEVSARRRHIVSTVEVYPEFADGLDGIDAYSHLFVLFWMDRVELPPTLRWHPRGNPDLPACGAFASRGRNHPNRIGLAVVELLGFEDRFLTVKRLDAWNGTPVIDIKPYDDYDIVNEPQVPDWFAARARRRDPV